MSCSARWALRAPSICSKDQEQCAIYQNPLPLWYPSSGSHILNWLSCKAQHTLVSNQALLRGWFSFGLWLWFFVRSWTAPCTAAIGKVHPLGNWTSTGASQRANTRPSCNNNSDLLWGSHSTSGHHPSPGSAPFSQGLISYICYCHMFTFSCSLNCNTVLYLLNALKSTDIQHHNYSRRLNYNPVS